MAVMITNECINCDSCIEECPATAIVSAENSPLKDGDLTYVKPEKCIECVDCSVPKCVDICPTEGAIAWDMPYVPEFNEYYLNGQKEGKYAIRVHKKKGILSPSSTSKPYREVIAIKDRETHAPISF